MEYGMNPVIEIKSSEKPFDPESLAAILNARTEKNRITVISFSRDILLKLKGYVPGIKMYLLKNRNIDDEDIAFCVRNGLDGIDFHKSASGKTIKAIHAAGLGTMVWTVDSVKDAAYFRSLGVTAITTNTLSPAVLSEEKPAPPAALDDGGQTEPANIETQKNAEQTEPDIADAPESTGETVPADHAASESSPSTGNPPTSFSEESRQSDSLRSDSLSEIMKYIGRILKMLPSLPM